MEKTLNIFIILIIFGLNNFAQRKPIPPCELTVNQAPKLRGFSLGQTKDETFLRIPEVISEYYKSSTQPDNIAIGKSEVYLTHSTRQELNDVDFILHFLDEKIIYIYLSYTEYEPDNLKMFMEQVSETTNLPLESWKITGKYTAEMSCKGFNARIWTGKDVKRPDYLSYPSLSLYDLSADIVIEAKKKEIERRRIEKLQKQKQLELERELEEKRKKKIFKP